MSRMIVQMAAICLIGIAAAIAGEPDRAWQKISSTMIAGFSILTLIQTLIDDAKGEK